MSAGPGWDTLIGGDVSERPKELASKASVVQATEGSNPSVTATGSPARAGGLLRVGRIVGMTCSGADLSVESVIMCP